MSYSISLNVDGRSVEVEPHMEGSNIVLGGLNLAEMDITYNYSEFYYMHLDSEKGIRWLYGRKAKDTIKKLENAVRVLGTDKDDDYWKSTRGNAGHVLNVLLGWAKQHPEGIWEGD